MSYSLWPRLDKTLHVNESKIKVEKYTMFVNQKNQYSENEYTTQSNL